MVAADTGNGDAVKNSCKGPACTLPPRHRYTPVKYLAQRLPPWPPLLWSQALEVQLHQIQVPAVGFRFLGCLVSPSSAHLLRKHLASFQGLELSFNQECELVSFQSL